MALKSIHALVNFKLGKSSTGFTRACWGLTTNVNNGSAENTRGGLEINIPWYFGVEIMANGVYLHSLIKNNDSHHM